MRSGRSCQGTPQLPTCPSHIFSYDHFSSARCDSPCDLILFELMPNMIEVEDV